MERVRVMNAAVRVWLLALSLLLAASCATPCTYRMRGRTYDLGALSGRVLSGGDPRYPSRLYNASVCGALAPPCIDELSRQPLNGSVYQLTLAPTGIVAFCWDVLAHTGAPALLPPNNTGWGPQEAFVLRHTHAGDAHLSCSPNMTVDLRLHCLPNTTDQGAYKMEGTSDVQCHFNIVIQTPLVCTSQDKA